MAQSETNWVRDIEKYNKIPTELIGSLPRSAELVEAQRAHKDRELTTDQLALLQEKDIQSVLFELERTGSTQLTDGELTKPSYLNYPVSTLQYLFDY
jgi:5-methyltetrahydropteroyltriglutamate--homocysteine methyltransferase